MTESIENKSDFRNIAMKAYEEIQERINEDQAVKYHANAKEARAAFIKWFEIEPDAVNGFLITSGDVTLRFVPTTWDSSYGRQNEGWQVVGECPRCHIDTFSPWCGDLENIGHYLCEFTPDFGHVCKAKEADAPIVTKTIETRLMEIICEIISVEIDARNRRWFEGVERI